MPWGLDLASRVNGPTRIRTPQPISKSPSGVAKNPDFRTKGGGLAMGGKPRQFGVDQTRSGSSALKSRWT